MVYITGDMHADIDVKKFASNWFPEGRKLTKEDYMIICGDFGLVWDDSPRERYWQKWLSNKPWTTLFIDGNHENFDKLFQLPEIPMFGDTVRKVTNDIYYLQRGHIYEIQGKTFFAMGGARSHDKQWRKEGISWWPQEIPNEEEFEYARNNASHKIDYVLTHCAPANIQATVWPDYEQDQMTKFLQEIYESITFEKWFFGHYHEDKAISEKFRCLYNSIIRII